MDDATELKNYCYLFGQQSPIDLYETRITRIPKLEQMLKDNPFKEFPNGARNSLENYLSALHLSKGEKQAINTLDDLLGTVAFLRGMKLLTKRVKQQLVDLSSHIPEKEINKVLLNVPIRCPTFTTDTISNWTFEDFSKVLHRRPQERNEEFERIKRTLLDPATPAGLLVAMIGNLPHLPIQAINRKARFNIDVYSTLIRHHMLEVKTCFSDLQRLKNKGFLKDETFVEELTSEFSRPENVGTVTGMIKALEIPDLPATMIAVLTRTPLRVVDYRVNCIVIEPPFSGRSLIKTAALVYKLYAKGIEVRICNKSVTKEVETSSKLPPIEYFNALIKLIENYNVGQITWKRVAPPQERTVYISSILKEQRKEGKRSIGISTAYIPLGMRNGINCSASTHLDLIGVNKKIWAAMFYWFGKGKELK